MSGTADLEAGLPGASVAPVSRKPRGGGHKRRPRDDSDASRHEAISRTLSWMLRHHAAECKLTMRPDGFVPLHDVLATSQLRKLHATFAEIQAVVAACPKQRFALLQEAVPVSTSFRTGGEGDTATSASTAAPEAGAEAGAGAGASPDECAGWLIRANQGHSKKTAALLDDHALLERITPESASSVPCCVHGTYRAAWPAICASGGLKKMARMHVHFASGELGSDHVKSGLRSSAEIYCYLDVPRALAEGLVLFRSANGVLLSPGFGEEGVIPLRLFSKFTNARTGEPVAVVASEAASGAGSTPAATASS